MLKSIIAICLMLINLGAVAASPCAPAAETNSPNFCTTFQATASCYCTSKGLPVAACTDMKQIYERMISLYGTKERACLAQRDTTSQQCLADWHCYLNGGLDPQGRPCNSSGNKCARF